MAGRMPKRGRYQKCVQAIIEARQTGNPQKVKEALTYLVGVSKQFLTVDQLTHVLDFWFSEVDKQEWIVDILREPYIEAGTLIFQDLDETPPTATPTKRLTIKNNGL